MEKELLIQLLSDCSVPQNNKNYENRVILDSDFDALCDNIIKIHKEKVKSLEGQIFSLESELEEIYCRGDH